MRVSFPGILTAECPEPSDRKLKIGGGKPGFPAGGGIIVPNDPGPVSGGSISGNVRELLDGFRFSKETRQYDCLLIPAVTRLRGVTVTGAGVE